jgi:hypothetical protein
VVQTLYFLRLLQLVVVGVAQVVGLLLAEQRKAVALVAVVVHQLPLDLVVQLEQQIKASLVGLRQAQLGHTPPLVEVALALWAFLPQIQALVVAMAALVLQVLSQAHQSLVQVAVVVMDQAQQAGVQVAQAVVVMVELLY